MYEKKKMDCRSVFVRTDTGRVRRMVRLCKNNIEVLEDGFCYLVFRQIAKTLEIPVNIDRDLSGAWYPFPNLYIINQLFNGFPV